MTIQTTIQTTTTNRRNRKVNLATRNLPMQKIWKKEATPTRTRTREEKRGRKRNAKTSSSTTSRTKTMTTTTEGKRRRSERKVRMVK